ncbi:MAG: hypothetical protein FWC89_00110 [Defluviitaleaceae bacterium]|nr:hypothetical protein [Defluviitaleaceae bacterium]
MTGHTERVILVKGDSTKWYNQAIFIVNQNMPATKMPVDFVAEAEKIIYNHITKERGKKAVGQGVYTSQMPKAGHIANPSVPRTGRTGKKKASKFDFALNVVMVLACVAIVAVFVYGMMA